MAFVTILDYSEERKGESWTGAFAKAIEAISDAGGGTLYVPAGCYLTGPIMLKSNVTLYLEAGARIKFEDKEEEYRVIEISHTGKAMRMYQPLIYGKDLENVAICGRGLLDGQGKRWWDMKSRLREKGYWRPHMICFERCRNVRVAGISLVNSPAWTVHPLCCDNVSICGISIRNPKDSPNTDGINPNSSRNVRITDCLIDVGDDCIAIKAGTEDSENPAPCENIVISNCNMVHGHGGIVIGSEMSGTIRNVTVSNCVFQNTDRGIRLKTRRKRGGRMERLSFQNIVMDYVICPVVMNMYYYCGARGKESYVGDKRAYPVDESTPTIRDVRIMGLTACHVQSAAGFFYGLAEMKIENVSLTDCFISMDRDGKADQPAMMGEMPLMSGRGMYIRNVKELRFSRVEVEHCTGEKADVDETVSYEWI